eukprot:CAMPEP_0204195720 /NCGR_PEP_ID=MMETSP0361-20130328/63311_1 /ASSEMBLY_ACC=CAM_ASM_000343 /TAXON_ID=268821 /ORGANISM="Scrippsiella Hangoei, Strain SHTV-5" /LENGTH=70 /DNA_ID=CAMNT_0051157341 /DNA_START=211 /DNA_END=421 /DNA_ORIENTATION=+
MTATSCTAGLCDLTITSVLVCLSWCVRSNPTWSSADLGLGPGKMMGSLPHNSGPSSFWVTSSKTFQLQEY